MKQIIKGMQIATILYLGIFCLWLLMMGACMGQTNIEGYEDINCGDNEMTRMVKVTHKPLISLLNR
jgi:hypothetical protein